MADPAHEWTDKELAKTERQMAQAYQEAYKQAKAKTEKLAADYADKLKDWQVRVKARQATEDEFKRWRSSQAATATWWRNLRDQLAADYVEADRRATAIAAGKVAGVYGENHDWGTYDVERKAHMDTAYSLYDRDTVHNLVADELQGKIAVPKVDPVKDLSWNQQHLTSAVVQSVLLGESVDGLARRFRTVSDMNKSSAVRCARTAFTGAESAGRQDAYERAKAMGIPVKKQWLSTHDSRTRESHAIIDGETVELNERFSNGLRYPGDPTGSPSEVWNCRCTTVVEISGNDADWGELSEYVEPTTIPGSYKAWKEALHRKQQQPRRNVKVCNEALYNSQKNYVERHGGTIIRGDTEWEKYLIKTHKDAVIYNDAIILRRDATTSEVLEEVYHFKQNMRKDYSEFDDIDPRITFNLRERDAQEYLLSVTERYNIPKDEVEQTKRNLEGYLQALKEAGIDEDYR